MPFNSNLPVNGSPIVAAELREQFNALKSLIDAQQAAINALDSTTLSLQTQLAQKVTMADVNAAIAASSANNVDSVTPFSEEISDPPQKVEVEDLSDKLNELIGALQH